MIRWIYFQRKKKSSVSITNLSIGINSRNNKIHIFFLNQHRNSLKICNTNFLDFVKFQDFGRKISKVLIWKQLNLLWEKSNFYFYFRLSKQNKTLVVKISETKLDDFLSLSVFGLLSSSLLLFLQRSVVRVEIEKSGMADRIWKEKGNHLPYLDEVEIIDWAERWRVRRLKESAHMLGYNNLLSRPSIELNTIWEPMIKNG